MAKITQIVDRIIPKSTLSLPEKERYTMRVALLFSVIATFTIICYGALFAAVGAKPLFLVAVVGLVGSLCSFPMASRWKNYRLVAINVLFWSEFCITWTTIGTGGLQSPILFWQFVFPLATILMLGHRYFLLAASVPIAGFMGVWFFEDSFTTIVSQEYSFLVQALTFTLSIFVCSAFAMVYQLNREQAHAEEERLKKDAQESLYAKHRLFRILCHDVVSPLQVIMSASNVALMNEELDENSKKLWTKVNSSAHTQRSIIQRASDLEALSSGKMELELCPISVGDVISETVFLFEHRMLEKDINLNVECENQDIKILADPVLFTHGVLNNLLSNAIKFTKPGSTINLKVFRLNERVTFEISDKGIGIPADLLMRLFDPSQATTRRGTSGERGSGFGLPLVKSYLDMSGGEIRIESRCEATYPKEHGTIVTVSLQTAG